MGPWTGALAWPWWGRPLPRGTRGSAVTLDCSPMWSDSQSTCHPNSPWHPLQPLPAPDILYPLPVPWWPYSTCWSQCPLHPLIPCCPLSPLHLLMPPTPPDAPYTPAGPNTPYPQNRNLVVKSGTTAGEHDMSSACGSGCCFVRCIPTPSYPSMPSGRGIWWPRMVLTEVLLTWAHVLLSAIDCLVCYCCQFAIDCFHEDIRFTIYHL